MHGNMKRKKEVDKLSEYIHCPICGDALDKNDPDEIERHYQNHSAAEYYSRLMKI
jgi:hypothetical protein